MNATPDQVKFNIETDIHACQELLKLMESERVALKERDVDSLQNIIDDKSTNLMKLESNARQRSQWAALSQQTGPMEKSWVNIIESTNPTMLPRWQELKENLQLCRNQNEINGKLLSRNQQIFTRLLNVVRGQSDAPNLYNQSGARMNGGQNQSIGEA